MDELVEQNGKRYKRITSEQAFSIRCDVRLYMWDSRTCTLSRDPESYMTVPADHGSRDPKDVWWQQYEYYIEIDDTKPEYEPL